MIDSHVASELRIVGDRPWRMVAVLQWTAHALERPTHRVADCPAQQAATDAISETGGGQLCLAHPVVAAESMRQKPANSAF
jgi:hypothetical protein